MKILLINDSIGSGSVGKIITSIYTCAVENGNECKIAFGRSNNSKILKKDLVKIGSSFSVLLDAFLTRVFGGCGTHSFFSTKRAIKQIQRFHPDIINVHSFYGYYINSKLIVEYAKRFNIPIVLTLHSCWDFTGHCCYFSLNNCDMWKSGCKRCKYIRTTYPVSIFFDNTHKNYELKSQLYSSNTHVVSPSMWISNLAQESLLKGSSFHIIRNGINLEIYKTKNILKFDKPTVLCVANVWDRRKGLVDVFELAEFLESQAQIIVVGLTKKQIKKAPAGVICMERTSSLDELVALYNKSTIFFNPTYEDNYPTVNLEAQACGLPVVTYDSGGSRETIVGTNMGIAIKPKDYNAVKVYLEDRMVHQVERNIDHNILSDKRMANEYLDLFSAVLAKK